MNIRLYGISRTTISLVCHSRRDFSSKIPEIRCTSTDEWVKKMSVNNHEPMIFGITFHAQDQLGEIVYFEVDDTLVGKDVKSGDVVCTIESVKSVTDIEIPMDGKIVEINKSVQDTPGTINSNPEDDGWLLKFKPVDPEKFNDLIDSKEYNSSKKQ